MMSRRRQRGISLIEVALSLFLLALLLGGMIVPLQAQLESRMEEETQRLLEDAREALLGYVAANGYFPCPADATSKGYETAVADHDTGDCVNWFGFLPAADLGLTRVDAQGYAIDAWGGPENRIRYAIANQPIDTVIFPLTSEGGVAGQDIEVLMSADLLHVCASGVGTTATSCGAAANVVTTNAAVVIWSVGPNARTAGTGVHEIQNPNPNGSSADRVFVSRPRSLVAGSEFDDVVVWVPMALIVNRMVAIGQLP